MSTIAKPPLLRISRWQLLAALVLTGVVLPMGRVQAYSFLIGCLIQIGGSAYFARLAWRYQGARQAHNMLATMYRGATGKIVLSAAAFAVVFALVKPLDALLMFAGYLIMVPCHALLAARVLQRTSS